MKKVRILRLLQHSNVVSVYQFFKDDPDYYYTVLEHMAGGELFDRIVQKVRHATTLKSQEKRAPFAVAHSNYRDDFRYTAICSK